MPDPTSASASAPLTPPSRFRSWWMQVHLYGGLVCFWYLLIYGVTSLGFNHPGLLPERRGDPVHWERPVRLPEVASDADLGEAIRRELDLIGWVLPWTFHRQPSGDLRFEVSRPGRQYVITTDRSGGRVQVESRSTGIPSVLHFLHGSTEGVPGSAFSRLWGVYTEVTTWLVLFLTLSGVVLWWRRARDRRRAVWVLISGSAVSAALMLWVWLLG